MARRSISTCAAPATQFAIRFTNAFINNAWSPPRPSASAARTQLLDPATDAPLATVAACGTDDVDAAVHAARSAFEAGPWGASWTGSQRRQLLHKVADRLDQSSAELAWLESVSGKPIRQAKEDVGASIECLRHFAGYADRIQGKYFGSITNPHQTAYTIRSPIGVCGLITSFNYPLLLAIWKLAPALAAGNTVVIKPGIQTPLSTLFLANAFLEAGAPSGVVNVVTGGAEVGQRIVEHPNVGMVSFTGSTHAGKQVAMSAASPASLKNTVIDRHGIYRGPRPCTLELGGKNALIVDSSITDIPNIASVITSAAFTNMGQNCCAGSRVLIHESIYKDVVSAVNEHVNHLVIGHPCDERTDIGPLVSHDQMSRVLKYIELIKNRPDGKYGHIATGGRRIGTHGNFVEPTVVVDVDDTSPIACDEIFGPILAILKPFKTIEEAVRRANATEYGLAAGIYSSNLRSVQYATNYLQAGIIWVNCYNDSPSYLPFGGIKSSGYGKDLGLEAVKSFTVTKSVLSARL